MIDWIVLVVPAQVAGAFLGSAVGSYLTARRTRGDLRRQDRQLEWLGRVLEDVARDCGSMPPPREKLTTLSGSDEDRKMWDGILAEAARKERKSR